MSKVLDPELRTPEINRAMAAWRPNPSATTMREWQECCERYRLADQHRRGRARQELARRLGVPTARRAALSRGATAAPTASSSYAPMASDDPPLPALRPGLTWFDFGSNLIVDTGLCRRVEPEDFAGA